MYFSLKFLIVDDMQDWSLETPRDVSLYISPYDNTTIIYPRSLEAFSRTQLDMLLVVTSDPLKSERRNAIRQTWGKDPKDIKLGVIFLMGLTRNPEVSFKSLNAKTWKTSSLANFCWEHKCTRIEYPEEVMGCFSKNYG